MEGVGSMAGRFKEKVSFEFMMKCEYGYLSDKFVIMHCSIPQTKVHC